MGWVGWLVLAGVLVLAAGLGRWWWVAHPKVRCGWCRGSGRNPLSTKLRSGDCKHCGGSGRRDTRKKE